MTAAGAALQRQFHLPSAVKEAYPQLLLEFGDGTRHRRLGHVLLPSGSRKAAGASDGEEVTKMLKIHRYYLWIR